MSINWNYLEEIAPLTVEPFREWLDGRDSCINNIHKYLLENNGSNDLHRPVEGFKKLNEKMKVKEV